MNVEITIMPPFQPTEYLWTQHADKGKEKWQIYAWAVRDVMAKVGGFGKHDQPFREKMNYYNYVRGNIKSYIPEPSDDSKKNQ